MIVQQLAHKHLLFTFLMVTVTILSDICVMFAHWMNYKDGYAHLWMTCVYTNVTTCEEGVIRDCVSIAGSAPGWLSVCQTMASLSIAFTVFMGLIHFTTRKTATPPTTFIGHLTARMILFLYFFIGVMMLISAILYHSHFEAYYRDEGKGEKLRKGFGLIMAYVGGGFSILNSIYLCICSDTGFKVFLKNKFKPITNSNNGNSNTRTVRRQNTTTTSSRLTGATATTRQRATTVFPRSERENRSSNSNIITVGNESNSQTYAGTRARSVASVSHLNVEVGSASRNGNNNILILTSHRNRPREGHQAWNQEMSGPTPTGSSFQPPPYSSLPAMPCPRYDYEANPHDTPPSYEDAIRTTSGRSQQ